VSILFSPFRIGNLELRNRFVRSATFDPRDDERGFVTPRKIDLYSELAQGGVGLIITGTTSVYHFPPFRWPNLSYIDWDESIPHFRRLTEAVHAHGAKIAAQLFHDGRDEAYALQEHGIEAMAPSVVQNDPFFQMPHRAMAEREIWAMARAFGEGARRAREAGFDAIQLHAAHGYLFSQFLSPLTNRRRDGWGGALEGRMRFHREVLREVRSKVGEDFPILIKLGVEDAVPGGLEFQEGRRAAVLLAERGVDALEISLGLRGEQYAGMEYRPDINRADQEAYYLPWAMAIKADVDVPVIAVGGLRSFEVCEAIVENGEADLVSMSRPFIREPHLVADWMAGDRHTARCISCNDCLERLDEDLLCWQDVSY
jgi:2,4-dienoyl-CoA reductase-like NADH-dependent reductase (Old Yellow Enzyme family)